MCIPTKETVLQAMDEFNNIGERAFCRKYKRRRSRTRYLRHDGVDYPVKALWAAAYRPAFEGTMPETTVIERQLADLGFTDFVRHEHNNLGGGNSVDMEADGFDVGIFEDNMEDFDERKRGTFDILLRPVQYQFRSRLIEAYRRCMISGCMVEESLEAAHIIPYSSEGSNHLSNGLLLRADIHRLFDRGLIAIDQDDDFRILLDETLRASFYRRWHEQRLRLPKGGQPHPSKEALRQHMRWTSIRR